MKPNQSILLLPLAAIFAVVCLAFQKDEVVAEHVQGEQGLMARVKDLEEKLGELQKQYSSLKDETTSLINRSSALEDRSDSFNTKINSHSGLLDGVTRDGDGFVFPLSVRIQGRLQCVEDNGVIEMRAINGFRPQPSGEYYKGLIHSKHGNNPSEVFILNGKFFK